ncbi:MAG TPA: hypothetical protein DCY10_07500, partial [Clostridiales bacterium]|nr:hypothetical protein [Clostridiales bacterium]
MCISSGKLRVVRQLIEYQIIIGAKNQNMLNFEFYSPTRIVFGKGTADQVGEQIAPLAKKVLVHYGSDRVLKSGL